MRCLALGQAWQDVGGRVIFATADSPAAMRRRVTESSELADISGQAGTAADAIQIVELAKRNGCEWIAVDGYHFGEDYQRRLKERGFKVLLLDDYGHAAQYIADLVLNQNVSARESLYASRSPLTRLLLGPRYCLLRREFLSWRNWKREVSRTGRRVLVTMGGSDPENVTARVIDALTRNGVEGLEAKVVVGGSNPHAEMLELLAVASGKRISVCRDVANIAELMSWADVAVSSAGTTCWELCLMALPSVLIDVAANQTALARELDRRRCAIHVGGAINFAAEQFTDQAQKLLRDFESRWAMSVRCRELVDGLGSRRVVSAMLFGLRLRPVRGEDKFLLWEWANDPKVRAAAFSSAAISPEQHEVWFVGKMKDSNSLILIAEDDAGAAVGQFRVDWVSDEDGEIDVSVASAFRGGGYGSMLIELGVAEVFAQKGTRLHAFVKTDNEFSRRAFERAGFANLGERKVREQRAIHYLRVKESGAAEGANGVSSNSSGASGTKNCS